MHRHITTLIYGALYIFFYSIFQEDGVSAKETLHILRHPMPYAAYYNYRMWIPFPR